VTEKKWGQPQVLIILFNLAAAVMCLFIRICVRNPRQLSRCCHLREADMVLLEQGPPPDRYVVL
jgi:hypothetical protein